MLSLTRDLLRKTQDKVCVILSTELVVVYQLAISVLFLLTLLLLLVQIITFWLSTACTWVSVKPKYNIFALGPCRRAFPVAGPTVWNSLPDNVISVTSLSVDRITLEQHQYDLCWNCCTTCSCSCAPVDKILTDTAHRGSRALSGNRFWFEMIR